MKLIYWKFKQIFIFKINFIRPVKIKTQLNTISVLLQKTHTHYFSIVRIADVYRKNALYSVNNMKTTDKFCRRKSALLNVKACGKHSYVCLIID
jgi:hypothetical protein